MHFVVAEIHREMYFDRLMSGSIRACHNEIDRAVSTIRACHNEIDRIGHIDTTNQCYVY